MFPPSCIARVLAQPARCTHASQRSFSMGSVPPEDFASSFNFPLDLIKVTGGAIIAPEEVRQIRDVRRDGERGEASSVHIRSRVDMSMFIYMDMDPLPW